MPAPIAKLAQDILVNPVRVDIAPPTVAVDRINQRVFFVGAKEKRALLESLLADQSMDRVLVFTRTKRGADRVCRNLTQAGFAAVALHGNKAQNARVKALDAFRAGRVRILVATDIAARGIDVPNITHVINYELPNEPESYVHRIGRTARAGANGAALAFCDQTERPYLQAIERLMRSTVTVGEHRLAVTPSRPAPAHKPQPQRTAAHKPQRTARAHGKRQPQPQGRAPASGNGHGRSNGQGFAGLPRSGQPSSKGERAHSLRGDLR
jgi:ATP-dependent RNA helicase RhlE